MLRRAGETSNSLFDTLEKSVVALYVRETRLGEKGENQTLPLQERIQNHPWERHGGRESLEAGEKPSWIFPALLGERISETDENAQSSHYSVGENW